MDDHPTFHSKILWDPKFLPPVEGWDTKSALSNLIGGITLQNRTFMSFVSRGDRGGMLGRAGVSVENQMTAAGNDVLWMNQALALAARGQGFVEPNPMVGAVLIRNGECVGEGWHQKFGGPHAEVHALTAAADRARESTLYVTLEPCCHQGKTPPCTDAILRAGVQRVVVAMRDPYQEVAGKGLEILSNAGIQVEVGIQEEEARLLNAPYLHLLQTGRSWVIAKWAMTLDGRIATSTGQSRWISNETSRTLVHQIRGRVDGIVVGIGTALADDPMLNARLNQPPPRIASRIVVDSHLRLSPQSRLAQTAREIPTLIATLSTAEEERADQLRQMGCELVFLSEQEGKVHLPGLLEELGRRRFTNLLIEGGSEILGSLLDERLIDEVHVFLAPALMGGVAAKSPIMGHGRDSIADMLRLRNLVVRQLEGDVYLVGRR